MVVYQVFLVCNAKKKFEAEIKIGWNGFLRNVSWHIIMIYIQNIYYTMIACTTLQALTLLLVFLI